MLIKKNDASGASNMSETALKGVIHGRTIELDADAGLADGERVEVIVRRVPERREPGIGFLRTEGALDDERLGPDDPVWDEWDAIMLEVHRARKIERRHSSDEE
jgi:hypothetical protein